MPTWYGIDFSGNTAMWSPGQQNGNVWIARISSIRRRFALIALQRVQDLPGEGAPFDRLVDLLQEESFTGAGIDAPFSLPEQFAADHGALLQQVEDLPRNGQPFPSGSHLVELFLPAPGVHVFRRTEQIWRQRGLNLRPTMWSGTRPGAPMTAACLELLRRRGRPIWPFAPAADSRLLVEAFPAAQLRTWCLPHQKYTDDTAPAIQNRQLIVQGLSRRLDLRQHEQVMLDSADAIDAVLAGFAAIAVSRGQLFDLPVPGVAASEGWIAVHR